MDCMSLRISRILHAGYVFECGETQIAFDPIFENPFSRNCYAYPSVQFDHEQIRKLKLSAVFISHYHDDHCSLESLIELDRGTPIYMYCVFEELFTLIRDLGFRNVYPLSIDAPVTIGSFEVTPRKALDSEVDSLFQIRAAGLNVLNVVDSWIDPEALEELKRFAPWDMVLWPFQTMREIAVIAPSKADAAPTELPAEWIEQLKVLNPRYIVPSSCQFIQESWSWYNHALFPISYRQFEDEIGFALPGSRVVRMNPSVSVELNEDTLVQVDSLGWVQPVGNQDVDYEYRGDLPPPGTAEISRCFPPLSTEQTERVYAFCQRELLEKFRSLDPSEEPYFLKRRYWRLSVYNHEGDVKDFVYQIDGRNIALVNENVSPLSWFTEVPLFKLLAALDSGESLTSMYVRVVTEIDDVDVLEDPLIRCLFTGVFGSYQIAQFERIKSRNALLRPMAENQTPLAP